MTTSKLADPRESKGRLDRDAQMCLEPGGGLVQPRLLPLAIQSIANWRPCAAGPVSYAFGPRYEQSAREEDTTR